MYTFAHTLSNAYAYTYAQRHNTKLTKYRGEKTIVSFLCFHTDHPSTASLYFLPREPLAARLLFMVFLVLDPGETLRVSLETLPFPAVPQTQRLTEISLVTIKSGNLCAG